MSFYEKMISMQAKDLGLAITSAAEVGLESPLTSKAHNMWDIFLPLNLHKTIKSYHTWVSFFLTLWMQFFFFLQLQKIMREGLRF